MFKSNPSPYNAPIRRLASRRGRPTVASITDLFVGSLVMASFCADHSPRDRRWSTIPTDSSKCEIDRCRGKHITDGRPLLLRKRLNCYRPSPGYAGVRCFRIQTIRSRALPQPSDDNDDYGDHPTRHGSYGERPSLVRQGEQDSNWGGDLDRNPHRPPPLPDHNPSPNIPNPSTTNNGASTGAVSTNVPLDRAPDPPPQPPIVSNNVDAGQTHTPTNKPSLVISSVEVDSRETTAGNTQEQRFELVANSKTRLGDPLEESPLEESPLKKFIDAMSDPRKSNQYIYRLYRDLPDPGVAHMPGRIRGELLRRFADPIHKRWPDARRYLNVVEDMIQADLHMSRSLWTSAIHLAGRAAGKVRKQDLVRAISVWRQMEHHGKIESDEVIFTVLFDIAIKAGQFTVAERIIEEMKKRWIGFTRFGQVSKIYYYGMVGDANGIRKAYGEFINSGNIVDTVVLNCLLASFSRVGDIKTVMELYESMLEAHRSLRKRLSALPRDLRSNEQLTGLLPALTSEMPFYRRKNRELGRQLKLLAALKNKYPEQHRAIQQALPLSPDTRTFHVLLTHHAYRSGNLERLMSILEDMEEIYAIPPRGMIYVILFEGFAWHGGKRKQWSADRLRYTWETFLRALYESKIRYKERFNRRTQKLVWENPLTRARPTIARLGKPKSPATQVATQVPSGIYTPLPLAKSDTGYDMSSDMNGHTNGDTEHTSDVADDEYDEIDDDTASSSDIDVDDLFSNPAHSREIEEEMAELDRQIENGVFLGRRIIIVILRAFGACCGPSEVLDVWLTIERLWHPEDRKPLDVQVIKEEVDKQLAKADRLTKMRAFRPQKAEDLDDSK